MCVAKWPVNDEAYDWDPYITSPPLIKFFGILENSPSHFPNVRSLTLAAVPLGSPTLMAINALPKLREMYIRNWDLEYGTVTDDIFEDRIPQHPVRKLTTLVVEDVYCTRFPSLVAMIDRAKLEKLVVCEWSCAEMVLSENVKMPMLKELTMLFTYRRAVQVEHLILAWAAIGRMPALETFRLDIPTGEGALLAGMDPIALMGSVPRNLHTLRVSSYLAPFFVKRCPIRELSLNFNTFPTLQLEEQFTLMREIRRSTRGVVEDVGSPVRLLQRADLAPYFQHVRNLTVLYVRSEWPGYGRVSGESSYWL
ncbi:hypothetical protein EIP91_011801 [Steccherinum ochraceum]|uniref:F-box domain-containing protein n=1 Tax=Steccherinum ochraceum TaxID=92696 RepID=A0A4V2MWX2_9APHY|nr:hypothetical protein EIP91_011801 [Steccherinum ochraceum]